MSDGAVASIVSGAVTIVGLVIGFMSLWAKLKYGTERKIDDNTAITVAGTRAAATNAKAAADSADDAKTAADEMVKQLNGKLEDRIVIIVKAQMDPVLEMIKLHSTQDDNNMAEIRKALLEFVTDSKLKEFSEYIHKRNHDMLNAMNDQSLKMDEVLEKMDGAKK